MKILIVLTFIMFLSNLSWAQESALKITNTTTQKEVIIKENKRIKIKTLDGNKISGRFKLKNTTILIGKEQIELEDIQSIKPNPVLISVLGSGVLIYGGIITAGFGVIIGVFVDSTAFLLAIPGAAMIYAGIQSPNISKNYKRDKNWNFEIITLSETTISQ